VTDPRDVVRRPAVRWLSPTELFRTGIRVALAGAVGQFTDNREMQDGPSFEQGVFQHRADGADFWLDYVSDTGDGFDATYSVASMLGGDLTVPDDAGPGLRRGDVLIMGGDEVYPVGDAAAYEDRTTRVFAMASPADPEPRPVVYAVPGNHDWYDGLTAFLRVFGQGEDFGSWRTQQARSYFVLQLPRNWWVLAIDIQLDTYIDKPQLDYFRRMCLEHIPDDASIILCTAKPSWYAHDSTRESMQRLLYFLRHALGGKGRNVRLLLTGDAHHYSRYSALDGDHQLITAGHGGAYTSATHRLPEQISVPARLRDPEADPAETETYVREAATWPTQEDSRNQARGVLWRLVTRNGLLVPFFMAVYWLTLASVASGAWVWTAVFLMLVAAGCVAFTQVDAGGSGRRLRYGYALATLQVLLLGAAVILFARFGTDHPLWGVLVAVILTGALGGLLAAELLAGWLLFASSRGVNVNETFAAQSIEDFKGFLRMRIDTEGVLTVFPIGLRRSVHEWKVSADGTRLVPVNPDALRARLIEPPVEIKPVAASNRLSSRT
jgi:hypothetical protein